MIKKLLLLILSLLMLTKVFAQDTQYWAKQHGTYGELLGGVVVGGISDLSATYYNPGSLPFIRDTVLILTTHSLQAYSISLNDAFGSDEKLSTTSVYATPGIFAVRLPFKKLGNNQIIISYITRYNFDYDAFGMKPTPYSTNQNYYTSNQIMFMQKLSEYWPGISWSNAISKNIGIGATLYFPYRSQSVINQALLQDRDSTGANNSTIFFENYSYYNLRALLKLGATFKLKSLMLGITVTTPSLNIFGRGEAALNITTTDDDLGLGENFISNYQNKLPTKFNSAMSVALGTAYYMENTSFYFTVEWFNKVNDFMILNAESFKAQSFGKSISYNANYSLNSVINVGLGIKHIVNSNFILYGSITSDQTSYVPNSSNKFALSNWDIIHIRSGSMFKFRHVSITFGLGYGFRGNFYDRIDFFNWGNEPESNVSYHQLDVIFGFTYKL